MSSESTLFAHIAPWLTDRIEDVAVEALGYVLSKSPAARRALAEIIEDGGTKVGSIAEVRTQSIGTEGERPDLTCYDEEKTERVLIEAKFWAHLTPNQPNEYLKRLPKDRPAALLFIAPAARLEELWQELCWRAREMEPKFTIKVVSNSGSLRTATVACGERRLMLTSWAALLGHMEDKANDVESDIGQLRGLTDGMDRDALPPFRSDDLLSESARYLLQVVQLVDDATYHAERRGCLNTDGLKATPWTTGYGRFIRVGGIDTWFGIHLRGWANHSDTPLWLSFWKGYRDQLEQANLADRLYKIDGRLCIPIEFEDEDKYYAVLNSVINSLARIARQFDSSCPDASNGVDSDFFLPWLRMDSGREFAGQMLNIVRIVDDATIRASGGGWIDLGGMIVKPQKTGYGRFIRIGGVKAWFGIHIGGWARHCDTPLWLRFDYHERERLASLTNDVFEIDWRYYIPIAMPSTLDDEAVLDSVVDSLKSIADQLKDIST
ncbi:MAG: hypothetical protein OXI80_00800 [Caldilineaceae bacterium]|nr:hypothetical protein [Caldilineaceae bacterium]MDE0336181.1 hypothetical protein [Caldilineaceae bacterium]